MKVSKKTVIRSKTLDYAAYCREIYFLAQKDPTLRKNLPEWLDIPRSSLNRDLRVGQMFFENRRLLDKVYERSLHNRVRLLQSISKKSLTLNERINLLSGGKGKALPFSSESMAKFATKEMRPSTESSDPDYFTPRITSVQDIVERLDRIEKKIDAATVLNGTDKAVVLGIRTGEEAGFSARGIVDEFAKNGTNAPWMGTGVNLVRDAAARLRIIGDTRFGFYSEFATTTGGITGGGNWRFNSRAKAVLLNILSDYSTALASKRNMKPKDVWNQLLIQLRPIGAGTAQFLTRESAPTRSAN